MDIVIECDVPELVPVYSTQDAAGADLKAATTITLYPGDRAKIPTGVRVRMPVGYEAQVRGRSGLTDKYGLLVASGTIDPDYRGEVAVNIFNLGRGEYTIARGDRIAQMVFAPFVRARDIRVIGAIRGDGGFGSTGMGM